MSRSINESIQTLENSLSDIKTSLSAKNVEGGEQIKVSEIAGLIDQIEAGGGKIEYTQTEHLTSTLLSRSYDVYSVLDGSGVECKFKISVSGSYNKLLIYFSGLEVTECDEPNFKKSGSIIDITSQREINFTVEGQGEWPSILFVYFSDATARSSYVNVEILDIPVFVAA